MTIVFLPDARKSRTSIHVISSSQTVAGGGSGFGASAQLSGLRAQGLGRAPADAAGAPVAGADTTAGSAADVAVGNIRLPASAALVRVDEIRARTRYFMTAGSSGFR